MWKDEPTTEKQLEYLAKFGYTPDGDLTKGRASDLIDQFQNDPAGQAILSESDEKEEAWRQHREVENAKDPDNDMDLEDAIRCRLGWWLETFNVGEICSGLGLKLWESHAKHFAPPTPEQAQAILDALDSAMPTWDKQHPELFYQTLELNHAELKTM